MSRKANQLKSENTLKSEERSPKTEMVKEEQPSSPGRFSQIIENISSFLQQQNVRMITGSFLLFFSLYFLFALISYLYTWKYDQDKVMGSFWSLVSDPELRLENWAGKMGGILSHKFVFEGFGVSSFLFAILFFIAGFRILFNITLIPFKSAFAHVLFAAVFGSLALSYFYHDSLLFLGGNIGYQCIAWLNSLFGSSGSALIIGFSLLTYLIVTFSLNFAVSPKQTESSEPESEPEETPKVNKVRYAAEQLPENNDRIELFDGDEKKNNEPELIIKSDPVAEPIPELEIMPEQQQVVIPAAETVSNPGEVAFEVNPVVISEPSDPVEQLAEDLVREHGEYDPTLDLGSYRFPTVDLLENYGNKQITVNKEELEANKNKILETLNNYKIEISKIMATIGPTVTLYEIIPAPGVKISRIKNLEDDIALSLSALGIRIIAPIPGKGTIGIEVPNLHPEMVAMRSIIGSEKFQSSTLDLPVALGKTISNEIYVTDLAKMPHLLMAGATGQGKSVGLNAILVSLLYKKHPAQIKFVLVDPKKVELTLFSKIERHFLAKLPGEADAIITDTTKVIHTLKSLCIEMDQRYDLLKEAQVRNLKEYNAKFISRKLNPNNGHRFLPYIVVVIDEFADLIITAGKEVETPIARLAQLARAIGIHLIIATQRPSVNIITGTIKANFPARIAFRVTSKIDSRTILDTGGADQLIGRGDMLFSTGNDLVRLQCAFVDTPEVEKICDFIGGQKGYPTALYLPEYIDETTQGKEAFDAADQDSMFEEAARIIVTHQQGSASLLQRKLKLGYNRAGRIIDQLEAAGIIGPFEGSKARQVLIPDEASLEQFLGNLDKSS